MKKVLSGLAIFGALVVLSSACKVHKGCEAYSKVEVKKVNNNI